MADSSAKRRREPYSRLICLGCRGRRIRCVLPDTTIVPSPEPQPQGKACNRCAQNGLACVVDFTTLGRPAQKRNRPVQGDDGNVVVPSREINDGSTFDEEVSHDVGDFLLSHPDSDGLGGGLPPSLPPTKYEMIEASFSAFHLLPALVARDQCFASSIGSQPLVRKSVLEIIDAETSNLLDRHLVWHRLYYPNIPSLEYLLGQVLNMERGHPERASTLFLLTLLYDLALDVPSVELAPCRQLQPTIRALLYHAGQQVLFSLSRTKNTILALELAAQYRPLVFTSSQPAAAQALKAVPYALLAKQIAVELGYDTAGARLSEALHGFETDTNIISELAHQCLHWIRLDTAHEYISNSGIENVFKFRPADAATTECVEALSTAALLGRLPVELLLPYSSTVGLQHMHAALSEMSKNWKDLKELASNIESHKRYTARERGALERALEANECPNELSLAVSHLASACGNLYHNVVKGCAMFFAVMCASYAALNQTNVQPDQAMHISNDIIHHLTSTTEDDPDRPSHRKFLETYGSTRIYDQEIDLANFVTASDTLVLDGVPFVEPLRACTTSILGTAKEIVEGQAARLKGWGGLDDRIDVQMILFQEVARRLEAMSATAGSPEALAKGCILTATAKLMRSLHRILQGFKRTAMANQRRGASSGAAAASSSSGSKVTPSTLTPGSNITAHPIDPSLPTDPTNTVPTITDDARTAESSTALPWDTDFLNINNSDDLFANWENWPQFDPADFSDLFAGVWEWEGSGGGN